MHLSGTNLGRRSRSFDRRSMIDRAILLVEKAASRGNVFQIDAETENLLQAYPGCGMTFSELRADVAVVAMRGLGPVQFG